MVPSISPYITALGYLMAKRAVGADPCVCPETSIIILFLRGRETSQGLCPQVSGLSAQPLRLIKNICDRRIEGNLRSSNPESMAPSISPYI